MKLNTEEWREDAGCKTIGPKIFFADNENSNQSESRKNDRLARSICNKCIVKTECLNYALNQKIQFGIWGGLSSRERNLVIKKTKLISNPEIVKTIINQTTKIKETL